MNLGEPFISRYPAGDDMCYAVNVVLLEGEKHRKTIQEIYRIRIPVAELHKETQTYAIARLDKWIEGPGAEQIAALRELAVRTEEENR